jgi:hypothetical protein
MFKRKKSTKYYVHNLILCIINKESELTTAPNPSLNPRHTGAAERMAATPFLPDTLPAL